MSLAKLRQFICLYINIIKQYDKVVITFIDVMGKFAANCLLATEIMLIFNEIIYKTIINNLIFPIIQIN